MDSSRRRGLDAFPVWRLLFYFLVLSAILAGCGTLESPQGPSVQKGFGQAALERTNLFKVENGQAFLVAGTDLDPGEVASRSRRSEARHRMLRAQAEEVVRSHLFEQRESISARLTGRWFRIPVQWSLDPTVGPVVLAPVQISVPPAGYVTDSDLVYQKTFFFPTSDGVYLYRWLTEHVNGTAAFDGTVLRYTLSDGGTQATLEEANGDAQDFRLVYSGTPLSGLNYHHIYYLASGSIGLMDEATLESYVIGTFTLTEDLNGVQNEGQFDLRMLAVKNLRVEPVQFDPSTDPNAVVTLGADILALPRRTPLFGDGWQPTGPTAAWRVGILDPDSTEIRVLSGESPVSAPDSLGRVASLEAT